MNHVPHWILERCPPSTSKPTRLMFAVDPTNGNLYYWNMTAWVSVGTSVSASDVDYTALVPLDWPVPTPTNVADALDVLAAVRKDVEIYADEATGSDTSPGDSPTTAVKTLTVALERIPPYWTGKCRIHLATGTYTMPTRWANGTPLVGGQRLLLEGTLSTVAGPYTIDAGGVTIDANGRIVIANAGMGLVGSHRGEYVEFLSGVQSTGPNEGWRYAIVSNTPTSITLMLPNNNAPSPGDSFRIAKPGTVLVSPAVPYTYTSVLCAFRDIDFDMPFFGLQYDQDCSLIADTCRFLSLSPTFFQTLVVTNGELILGSLHSLNGHRAEFDDFPVPSNWNYANGPVFKGVILSAGFGGYIDSAGMVFDTAGGPAVVVQAGLGGWLRCYCLDAVNLANATVNAYDRGILTIGDFSTGNKVIGRISTTHNVAFLVQTGGKGSLGNTQVFTSNGSGSGVRVADQGSYAELIGVTSPSPIARYGVEVLRGAYCKVDATTTAHGQLAGNNDFIVDDIPGDYVSNSIYGVRSLNGSQLDRGSPTLLFSGPVAPPGPADYMGFVLNGAVTPALVNCNIVKAGSVVRVTPLNLAPGMTLLSALTGGAAGAGNITLTFSAAGAWSVLIEVLKY